jgi:vacuolar protein sorting-associated protein 13A/C
VDNSIGSFFTQSGLDAAIKYKAYEIRHVINNYKPYTVHETEPATAVSRQLSGTTPDLDVLQQEGTTPQEVQRDESGVVVSQGLSSGRSYEKVARFKLIWWDKGSGSRDAVSIWRPIVPPGCAMLGDLAVQG